MRAWMSLRLTLLRADTLLLMFIFMVSSRHDHSFDRLICTIYYELCSGVNVLDLDKERLTHSFHAEFSVSRGKKHAEMEQRTLSLDGCYQAS